MILVFVLGSVITLFRVWHERDSSEASSVPAGERPLVSESLSQEVDALREQERWFAENLWEPEILAQQYGRVIEDLWDRLNSSEERLKVLAEVSLDRVEVGDWALVEVHSALGIESWHAVEGSSREMRRQEWERYLKDLELAGWVLDSIEFRHERFDPAEEGRAAQSGFALRADLRNRVTKVRVQVEGELGVRWKPVGSVDGLAGIEFIDGRKLNLWISRREVPFRLLVDEEVAPPQHAHSLDPMLVQDLDSDGRLELALANRNLLFRWTEEGVIQQSPLCTFPPGLISTAGFADLDADGDTDYLCVAREGLLMSPGSSVGEFDRPARLLWPTPDSLEYPMTLSFADWDRDGDLDVFLGQYRIPYEGGSLPTPFYDANDGYPFYLLDNQGDGEFVDVTDSVGLGRYRNRRIYSASLVDLDAQGGADLVVVSDFAGVDVYLNDGRRRFRELNGSALGSHYGFGMAHSFADFNRDGLLDLLMIGMSSPTVSRLEHLGLWRPGLSSDRSLRREMTVGNRLFLSAANGQYEQNSLSDSIARAGWAWGCGSGDFNNDGYPDVFIGNGLESRETVRDYESHYWLYDAWVADSENDSAAYLYFEEKFAATRGRGYSYGGYETDRLYMNLEGTRFVELGYLWGVGEQRDSRNVVVSDWDGDGRIDILMSHFQKWPNPNLRIKIYRNELQDVKNWIGFRVANKPGNPNPLGVNISLQGPDYAATNELVTGDSYRSQSDNSLHFGLGDLTTIDRAIITDSQGGEQVLLNPAINQYHIIGAPKPSTP